MYRYLRTGVANKIIQAQQLYISNLYKKNMTMLSVMIDDIQEINTNGNDDNNGYNGYNGYNNKLKSHVQTYNEDTSQYKYIHNGTVKNIIKLQREHIPKWYQDIIK